MKKIYTFLFLSITYLLSAQTPDKNITLNSIKTYSAAGSNICGYVDSLGNEYALFGWSGGVDVVNVSNPSNPVSVFNIPGASSIWREIKVNGKYAYITTEAGGGLKIAYLGNLPAANIPIVDWAPTINGGILNNIHALHIDNNKVYLFGANVVVNNVNTTSGAPIVADIGGANAANPLLIGVYYNTQPGSNNRYVHDGYVRNDTMYSCHIFSGYVSIVKFNNIGNSVNYLSTPITTPTAFPHNAWLNASSKNLFTTDENGGSFLACYNVSNLSNIQEADRIQSQNPNSGSVVHNTHIIKNTVGEFAVTSWYRDGVVITDVTRPTNIVNVGWYDTAPTTTGNGQDACWGVYPFLPSGRLITSGLNKLLHVLTPNYKRACYYEGIVVDSITNLPIANAQILMPQKNVSSDLAGLFKTGNVDSNQTVTIQKNGYNTKVLNKILVRGSVMVDTIKLSPTAVSIAKNYTTSEINLFPNPAENNFFIENRFTNAFSYTYQLLDISGKLILSGNIFDNKQYVSTKNINKGFYFLSIFEDGKEILKMKLIKH